MQTAIAMKETGGMDKDHRMESMSIPMEMSMKVSGRMI